MRASVLPFPKPSQPTPQFTPDQLAAYGALHDVLKLTQEQRALFVLLLPHVLELFPAADATVES